MRKIEDIDSEIKKVAYKSNFKPIIQWECRNCGFNIKHSIKPTYCSCGKKYSFFKAQKTNKSESMNKTSENILLEKLSDLEHQQWIEWSKAIAGADEKISEDRLDKWAGLWIPYKKLSEENKEKDRIWARKVLQILNNQEKKWR